MASQQQNAIAPQVVTLALPNTKSMVSIVGALFAIIFTISGVVWGAAIVLTNKADKSQVTEVRTELHTIKTDIAVIKSILQKNPE